jgi:hypothetical protein
VGAQLTYLPGGATAPKQDVGNASLASIDTKTPALVGGKVPVDIGGETVVIAIPAGAATAAKQDTGNTSLGSIDTKIPAQVSGRIPVDPSGVTSPMSAAALPLPAGASTSAAQTTGNASLASIDTKHPALVSGRIPVDPSGVTSPVAASAETGTVYNGATALTPLFATIVASASGASQVVAAVTSKKIRVLALQLTASAAVNVKWQSHVTPTDKTGLAYLAANGGYVLPFNPAGWFETIAGEALDINLSAAIAVGGSLTYVTV